MNIRSLSHSFMRVYLFINLIVRVYIPNPISSPYTRYSDVKKSLPTEVAGLIIPERIRMNIGYIHSIDKDYPSPRYCKNHPVFQRRPGH